MAIVYNHTNIVSHDPEQLAAFYIKVFGCVRQGPARDLHGEWLERGTGLKGARIRGVHLRLPGYGDTGPVLEIFRVDGAGPSIPGEVNRPGLMHICFTVDDVHETLNQVLAAGGQRQGKIVHTGTIKGVGAADFVYARDPDGNIVELVAWKSSENESSADKALESTP